MTLKVPNRMECAWTLLAESIVDDDDLIAAALSRLSVSALTASVVQITGDPAYVRGPIRPRQFVQNEFQAHLTPTNRTNCAATLLRRSARGATPAACRRRHCAARRDPRGDGVGRLRTRARRHGSAVRRGDGPGGENPRAIKLPPEPALPEGFSVLIVGLGASGAAGRHPATGSRYPVSRSWRRTPGSAVPGSRTPTRGCRVDVASHFYSYSFERNNDFSQYYTRQPELRAYFRKTMAERGIGEYVTWNTEVTRGRLGRGHSPLDRHTRRSRGGADPRGGGGDLGRRRAQPPLIPDIRGLDRFTGPVFHAAQWGSLGGSVRQAGRPRRGRGQWLPDRAGHRRRRRRPDRLPAHPTVDGAQSALPRRRDQRREVGDTAASTGYARWYRFMLMWQSSDSCWNWFGPNRIGRTFRTPPTPPARRGAKSSSSGSRTRSATTPN